MGLQVYSTLSRKKEPFHKRPGDAVTMYVCGPTVYKPSHIGHMVGPVIFDSVKRYLAYLGYKVTWVVNITDVDDKLIVRARELGTTVPELAGRMTQDYLDCLQKLNVIGIDHFPKATEHIGGMIAMISRLIEKGYAYPAGGDVYFDVSKDADYGKLCNRDPEQLEAGSRIEVSDRKRNPGDFALWKGAKPGEPAEVQFDSPWGKGRPGWHIECSVMATKLLGDTLDIHGGGLDLQFPHHENELAQSESATDKPFAHVWMHNGLLKMGSAKMAGSVGNVVNIADLLQRHTAETVRFLLLSTHYRSPIEYSEERLEEAAKSIERFHDLFRRYERITKESFFSIDVRESALLEHEYAWALPALAVEVGHCRTKFQDFMDDDFNTGGAVGALFELATAINRIIADKQIESREATEGEVADLRHSMAWFRQFTSILGLFWAAPRKGRMIEIAIEDKLQLTDTADAQVEAAERLLQGLMQLLIDVRNNLRTEAKAAAKDNPLRKPVFDQMDLIRQRLAALGVTLEDRPGGTTWRVG